jgi:hypothetical protein
MIRREGSKIGDEEEVVEEFDAGGLVMNLEARLAICVVMIFGGNTIRELEALGFRLGWAIRVGGHRYVVWRGSIFFRGYFVAELKRGIFFFQRRLYQGKSAGCGGAC